MNWLATTENEDCSQVITEKVTFSSFWLVGQVYHEEPNEMLSLPTSDLQGNMQDCREAHLSPKF